MCGFESHRGYAVQHTQGVIMVFSLLALVAAVFTATKLVPAGLSKFDDAQSAGLFVSLGGDKVRYFVGAAELVAPFLLLTPWTAPFGLALAFPVMAGAIFLHVAVWKNSPQNALVTLGAAILAVMFWAL